VEDKTVFTEMLNNVREKRDSLPTESAIKLALTDDILCEIESRIRRVPINELKYATYPPLLLFVYRNDVNTVQALEEDILLIKNNSSPESFNNLIGFLKASEKRPRDWDSAFFEVFIKAVLLKRFAKGSVILDKELPNGRNLDVLVLLYNRWINFEVTILSSSQEDYDVYNSFKEHLKKDPDIVLSRPGKYDPPNSKGPSPYYDEFRVYRKVYDKIADEKLDTDKSQMVPDEPNILLLFIGAAISPLSYSPGIGWAFDELFADQPRDNSSFLKWFEVEFRRLGLDEEWYSVNSDKIISAPRKLGGTVIFDGSSGEIIGSRMNYNANAEHKISHKEMAEIEEIFRKKPVYVAPKGE